MQNTDEIILKGIAASPGVAQGKAYIHLHGEPEIPVYEVTAENRASEIERFEECLLETRKQISEIRNEVAEKLGESEAQIFDAHLLVLEDQALIEETVLELEKTGQNIEQCFHNVSQRYIRFFDEMEDEYLKERAADIRDVTKRLLNNLLGVDRHSLNHMEEPHIIVSDDITPSDTIGLNRASVQGLVTDFGGKTSHSVILARALKVPAVIGLQTATTDIPSESTIIIDGYDGLVIINPSENTLFKYGELRQERNKFFELFDSYIPKPAVTADGIEISLKANIDGVNDVDTVEKYGANGVGLLRTEAIFIQKDKFPTEEEQFSEYKRIVEEISPAPIVIRTLDLGGDKLMKKDYFNAKEENPFMGFRAIRFCLKHTHIFRDQLRAILRASVYGKVKIMYPMICGLRELLQANADLDAAKNELKKEGVPFDEDIQIGCMIETPAAALIVDILAEHCDFLSIGTNDLTQYMLAVDRVNSQIAYLYEPSHPAVVRAIKNIVKTSLEVDMPISICGEIASDPLYIAMLIGLGCRELSGTPSMLPEIKYFISKFTIEQAEELVAKIAKTRRTFEIVNQLRTFYEAHMGEYACLGLGNGIKSES